MPTIERNVTDVDGTWTETVEELLNEQGAKVGERVLQRLLRTESAAHSTARIAIKTAADDRRTKIANNTSRLNTLALRAKRYALDPVANAADRLDDRLQHEYLARLWLHDRTDD